MSTEPLFGSLMTAMVTPFKEDGSLDLATARKLAVHLADDMTNDSIVVNGTTGEAPTTTNQEKADLIATVKDEVGDHVKIVAGVGTFDTQHSVELAKQAEDSGADGLLVVTPYYSRPPQDALIEHYITIADATELPIIVYDIPKRSGVEVETATMIELAKHPKIAAVKDAKGDVVASSKVMAATDLWYYAGDDAIILPLMAVGGVGVVGTSTHFSGRRTHEMMDAFKAGDVARAVELHRALLPVFTGVFATQGCMLVKAGLAHIGLPVGGLRRPMLEASEQEAATFAAILDAADL